MVGSGLPDVERCRRYAESTPQVATALNPLLGYEVVASDQMGTQGEKVSALILFSVRSNS